MDKKQLRRKVLELHYELSGGNSWNFVMRPDVGAKLGIDYNGDEVLGAIKYLEDKSFLKSETNVQDSITVYGIDEVENNFPTLGSLGESKQDSTELIAILQEVEEGIRLGKKGLLRLEECSDLEKRAQEAIDNSLVEGSELWREYDKERRQTRYKSVTRDGYLALNDIGELELWKDYIKKLLNKESETIKKERVIKTDDHYIARKILREILNKAKGSIAIQDNYIDETLFVLLDPCKQKNPNLQIRILTTDRYTKAFKYDLSAFIKQYGNTEAKIHKVADCHDRFILIDGKELYHSGYSFKDLGQRLSAINLMEDEEEKKKFIDEFENWWKSGMNII
jgi:hypothetical protein